ncbi:hypothetical protein NONI108955_12460 [Nocardia ninae]|uniref:Uncharacterized protein n=1 Tax=Nocardia ninae NBRC 108245 TaxID=1210091 RepID=A0A511MK34_9NOCA|nr:hypothetical protein [Nocardia ninae]GEM40983.1 hypothetical protein NN4_55020 [Nocardia ninae NBRC 108245]
MLGLRDLMAPGTVVDPALLQGSELIPHAGSGFRLVYRTTGQSEGSVISGGMVYVPEGSRNVAGRSFTGDGISGMTEDCVASRNGGAVGPVDHTPDLPRFLGAGYAVAASDYVGLGPVRRAHSSPPAERPAD